MFRLSAKGGQVTQGMSLEDTLWPEDPRHHFLPALRVNSSRDLILREKKTYLVQVPYLTTAHPDNAHCVFNHWNLSVTMVGPSPHKPRRKVKKSHNGSEVSSVAPSSARSTATRPTYPLAAFLWPARSSVSQWETLPLILMAVGLFRWAAGLWGYSGTFLLSRDYVWPT